MAMSREYPGQTDAPVDLERIVEDLARRFSGFPVPEGAFNPLTASPERLRQYGLPPRPDDAVHPTLRRAWDRGFGRPMLLEPFELEPELVRQTRYRLFSRHQDKAFSYLLNPGR